MELESRGIIRIVKSVIDLLILYYTILCLLEKLSDLIMADYSSYGKPSLEWEEFARLDVVAPTGLTPGQSIEALQTKTNASREIASAAYVLESGNITSNRR